MSLRRSVLTAVLAAVVPALLSAQQRDGTRRFISIGNHPRVDGVRINFRDSEVDRVRGANITLWRAHEDADLGSISGLALGLPLTSAGDLTGAGIGLAGVEVDGDAHGLLVGGLGAGAGGDARGIMLGGLGIGAGGRVHGIAVGGLGIGAGGGVSGITVGGLGVGSGGSVRGFAVGGLGVGAGGDARGILAGGLGAGIGGSLRGAALGGLGIGVGGDARGILVGGLGAGVGGEIRGIAIGGLGVGAGQRIHGAAAGILGVGSPTIDGLAIGAYVRSEDVSGVVIAPVHFRAYPGADVRYLSVATVSYVEGHQHGLAIGVVNFAHSLNGLQVGLVNIVRDNPSGRRVLPIVNWGNNR